MEMFSGNCMEDEQIELPPGFRFHPTDEELITHYLSPKVLNGGFGAVAIGEVDLNKVEPWDLPWRAKMGEKEWYFFCVRDRKYPTGLRTNRATVAGYWKATGKDKEIFKAKTLVGMKKTLVFYKGRAPNGQKTNWVMHEYRLEGCFSIQNLPKSAKNEWVICRIFRKTSGGKKTHISGLVRPSNCEEEFPVSCLPPLLDLSSDVPCFSNSLEDQKPLKGLINRFTTPFLASSSSSKPTHNNSSENFAPKSFDSDPIESELENLQYLDPVMMEDQSILRLLVDNCRPNAEHDCGGEFSHETGMSSSIISSQRVFEDEDYPVTSAGPVDIDCLWNY